MMHNTVGRSLYERRKSSYLNLILNVVIVVFFLVFITELIFNSFYTNIYVKGSSMEPTLNGAPTYTEVLPGGDYVFVNTKVKPDYFDIVVVETKDSFGNTYNIIKRAVAFGGDTVKIDRGQLYIKYSGDKEFIKVNESYVTAEHNNPTDSNNTFGEYVVPDGCMFLLGDNRNVSEDSRRKGAFKMSSLLGVVPDWSIKHKKAITDFYTFFEFKLGLIRLGGKIYGD